MKTIKKYSLSLLLSIVMVFEMIPFNVMAAENQPLTDIVTREDDCESVYGENSEMDTYPRSTFLDDEPTNTQVMLTSDTGNTTRDTVLVLDNSVSMEGYPLTYLKQAAIKFCESLLAANGINRAAIVVYDTDVTITADFTNDLVTLSDAINEMDGQGSWTNITAGVEQAHKFLQASNANVKNIVIMTDGVPTAGPSISDGKYSYDDYTNKHNADHYSYEYANALYETIHALFSQYNIYTFGFFHEMSDYTKSFASKVLNETQNVGYYEVIDPNDLEFTFGEIADDITDEQTQEKLQKEYVKEHTDYYQSSYTTDIVHMAATDGLGFMMDDADDDLSDAFYEQLSIVVANTSMIESALDLGSYFDIDWGNGCKFSFKVPDIAIADLGKSEYSVILYQLIASNTVYNGILDTFSTNYEKNAKKFAKLLSDKSIDLSKDINDSNLAGAKEAMMKAAETIRTADPSSPEFAAAYVDFESLGNQYLDVNKSKAYLEDLSSTASNAFTFLNSILDEIDSIGKAYQYICWAESYAETTETFKEVLKCLADKAAERANRLHLSDPFGSGDIINPYSEAGICRGLSEAIESYITTMDAYAKDAHGEFVNQVIDKTGDSCVDLAVEFLSDKGKKKLGLDGSICPELTALNAVLSTGKLLIDLFTEIDDEYKMAFTVKSLDEITRLLKNISDEYGKSLLLKEYLDPSTFPVQAKPVTLDMQFKYALKFDESIRMYKNAMLLACDYGTMYEKSKLTHASKMANTVPDLWYDSGATTPWQKQVSTSSTAINMLALQKLIISDIHCHDDDLSYDSSTGIIQYNGSRKVIAIACPVDVTVVAPDGTQLAYLTDDSATIASGYEPYFHVIPIDENASDRIKVVMIPDDENYQVLINGTDNGTMSVFVGKYNNDNITEIKTFANFSVTDKTIAHLDSGDGNNSLGYLVIDDKIYGTEEGSGTPTVTVTPAPKPKSTQKLSLKYDSKNKKIKRKVGSKLTQKVTGAKTKVTFSSSNPKVAKINKNSGVIRFVGVGKAVITAKAAESSQYKAASKKTTIYVIPKTAGVKSLKSNRKGQVTIKGGNKAKDNNGYQIQYKHNGKTRKILVKGRKSITKTFKNLRSKKPFKVRMRAYKKVGGKIYYGKYGKWKTLKKVR